ncbi:lactonase family protein [Microbacterium sp.]|uniref:lactonase family protein n=1 Tax=Microbacterium sp. TaxID=51671 RepID=UPI0039E350DF
MRIFLGGYTADMGGTATGIGVLHAGALDETSAGGALSLREPAVVTDSPSWIAGHPTLPVLYAALEARQVVQAFRRTGEQTLVPLGAPVEAGEAVCHVAVSPDGRALIASCWGDGRVVRMTLDAAGAPSSSSLAPAATDPYALSGMDAAEPRPSRAHQARFLPGGGLITTDLGLDQVRIWAPGGVSHEAGRVVLPLGSGPRHTLWHPSGHLYVVTELSCELFALAPDPSGSGAWRLVGGTPLAPGTVPGVDAAAEIALSRDGRFVYAGIRGSNTIAVVEVRGTGAELRPVALVESGVDWPRHHVVVRDELLVAGQLSNEVAGLTLDERTGIPGRARRRVEAPSPTQLLPDRA